MKKVLLLVGLAAGGYGLYLLWKTKKDGCGCTDTTTPPAKQEIWPDSTKENFDTKWRSLFPSPERLGQGPLPLRDDDAFAKQNFVL